MTATVNVPRRVAKAVRALLSRGGQRGHIDDCHPKQLQLVNDPRKRIAVQGGRRGGKSQALGRRLLAACERHPGETACYVTLTRGRARDILWDKCLARLNRKHGLGLKLVQREDLFVEHPNGARIWLVGVDDKGQIDKLRGGFFSEVVVDEAMAMPDYLRELVEEAIEPALMDLRGALVIAGTPSPVMAGYFWEATTGGNPDVEAWPVHRFTILDNPYLPHGAEDLGEKLKKDYGGNAQHPTYRREWLGEWVEDLGALVYPFTYAGNSWTPVPNDQTPFGLPPGDYSFGLGVDVGFSERSTAFTLAALRRGSGQIYLLRSYTRSRLIPTALAAHCQAVREEVAKATESLERPKGLPLSIVVDEGALGKGFAEQMRDMGVGCEAAEKSEKRAYQEYVGGLIRSSAPPYLNDAGKWEGGFGVLVDFHACAELIEEARKLQFDEETGKESEMYRRHCCFVAGTLVETERGPRPIESLRVGERVWTRRGLRSITAAWCTGVREVWSLRTDSGAELLGTADHPIWCENGFKPLDSLLYGDRIETWQKPNGWNGAARCGGAIPIRPDVSSACTSLGHAASACTWRSGKMPTDQCQAGTRSTIATRTRSTTRSRTSNASSRVSTGSTIPSATQREGSGNQGLLSPERRQGLGTDLMPAARGTHATPRLLGSRRAGMTMSAASAALAFVLGPHEQPSAPPIVTPSRDAEAGWMTSTSPAHTAASCTAPTDMRVPRTAPGAVQRVTATQQSAPVYNVTVDDAHEYFANGVLVSNCDSSLYIIRKMMPRYDPRETEPEPGSPEAVRAEMAKRKADAIKQSQKRRVVKYG